MTDRQHTMTPDEAEQSSGARAIRQRRRKPAPSLRFRTRVVSRIPKSAWVVLGLLALLALVSRNPGIGMVGVGVLTLATVILWRPGEPQALLFIVGFQWLQAFAPVLLALYEGERIAAVLGAPEFEQATVLGLLAVGAFAVGLRLARWRHHPLDIMRFRAGVLQLDEGRLFEAWIALTILTTALGVVGSSLPALRQGLIAFEVWKWAAVLLLFFRWLVTGSGTRGALLVLATETCIGMLGFFSGFKEVFFILLVAGSGVMAFRRQSIWPLLAAGAGLFALLLFWQAVKQPYREFMSKGERTQAVNVTVAERINWLSTHVLEVDRQALNEGFGDGLLRLGYVEYFGHSLQSVPALIPHTKGKLWGEAVMHPLMPRLLFPEKRVINDSDRTNAYTGVRVAGADQGTSISIGYVGESYIDFGKYGMFVVILAWGALVGACHEILVRRSPHPLLGAALAACLLLSTVLLLESSNIKMMGSLMAGFLVTFVMQHFFGKQAWAWITGGEARQARRRPGSKR